MDSSNRRLVDGVDGVLQCRVELLVGLLGVQTLGESTREACDEPVVVGEQLIGLLTGVPAGQGDDTHDPRIVDEVGVQVGLAGNRQLEHDPGVVVKGVDVLTDVPVQQLLGLLLACGVDVHLGFEDRTRPAAHT